MTTKIKLNNKNVSSCEKILTIEVPPDVVQAEFQAFYQAVSKRAKIPGFRPGHAPANVIARHFKNDARSEVFRQLVVRYLQGAVQQEQLPILGQPKVEKVDFDETHLKFEAHVEIKPKIKLDKYAGLSATRERVTVTDQEVDEATKRIQEARAKFIVVENRAAVLGDYLICDYELCVNGTQIEKREGEWIEIREKDYLDGFSKQLVGIKSGEERRVDITFPKDYAKKEFSGMKGTFLVMAKEIKEKQLPTLDDEFVKELGEHKTLQDLKDSIRKDLAKEKKQIEEQKVEHALLDELVKKSKFEIPKGVLARRVETLVDERIQTLMYRGVEEKQAQAQREDLKQTLQPEAERDVRISFLLDEIAKREVVQVTEQDLEVKYQAVADRFKRPLSEVKGFYAKDESRIDSLKMQVEHEKAVQLIRDKAKIKER